jgi:hypothetical protein
MEEPSIMDTFKDNVVNNTYKATEVAKDSFNKYATNQNVIVGLFVVIILALFISYGLYYIITRNVFNITRYIVPDTKVPIFGNQKTKIDLTYNFTNNGDRRSYTFWIYINDMNQFSGMYKHVLHIGGDSSKLVDMSPLIFLDKTENKMYVRFSNTESTPAKERLSSTLNSLSYLSDEDLNNALMSGICIPYIPLQRWVHVGIVVTTSSTGGNITTYVDGDISATIADDKLPIPTSTVSSYLKSIQLNKTGKLVIGGTTYDNDGCGFSGLISKFSSYNYDINQKDIYDDYNEGPIDSLFVKMGLGAYGFRNPLYKL